MTLDDFYDHLHRCRVRSCKPDEEDALSDVADYLLRDHRARGVHSRITHFTPTELDHYLRRAIKNNLRRQWSWLPGRVFDRPETDTSSSRLDTVPDLSALSRPADMVQAAQEARLQAAASRQACPSDEPA